MERTNIEIEKSSDSKNAPIAVLTGATGFIGSVLIHALKNVGIRVRVISRQKYQERFKECISRNDWYVSDLNQPRKLISACDGASLIFHVAGVANSNSAESEQLYSANVLATQSIYMAGSACGVEKFIFISSIQAIDPQYSAYARSKIAAEEVLTGALCSDSSTKVIILRTATVYGPGMSGFLKDLIKYTKSRISPSLPKIDMMIRLVSVYDLASVAISFAKRVEVTAEPEIYYVSDGNQYTVDQIQATIIDSLDVKKLTWSISRNVLLVGSLVLHLAEKMGVIKSKIGQKIRRRLVQRDAENHLDSSISFADFVPTRTLESEMPAIMASIDKES